MKLKNIYRKYKFKKKSYLIKKMNLVKFKHRRKIKFVNQKNN